MYVLFCSSLLAFMPLTRRRVWLCLLHAKLKLLHCQHQQGIMGTMTPAARPENPVLGTLARTFVARVVLQAAYRLWSISVSSALQSASQSAGQMHSSSAYLQRGWQQCPHSMHPRRCLCQLRHAAARLGLNSNLIICVAATSLTSWSAET